MAEGLKCPLLYGNCIMNALIQVARNASPYLVVELLLPGGSVIALLLWLFRHARGGCHQVAAGMKVPAALSALS